MNNKGLKQQYYTITAEIQATWLDESSWERGHYKNVQERVVIEYNLSEVRLRGKITCQVFVLKDWTETHS